MAKSAIFCFLFSARTSGGQSESTTWLTVMQMPYVRVAPKELFAAEGSTFNLSCAAEGAPKPEVTWFFEGNRIFNFLGKK